MTYVQRILAFIQQQNRWKKHRVRLAVSMMLVLLVGTVGSVLAWLPQAPTIPNSPSNVTWPDVSIDDTGAVHAVWIHTTDGDFSSGLLYYARGQMQQDGTIVWEFPQIINDRRVLKMTLRIVADNDGTVHVAFASTDGRIYYMQNPERGNQGKWQEEIAARPTDEFFDIDLALDAEQAPYIAWAEGLGNGQSRIRMVYKQSGWEWSLPYEVMSNWYYLVRSCELVVSGSGPTAHVHVVYEFFPVENDRVRVGYSHGQRDTRLQTTDFTGLFGFVQGDSPSIAQDPVSGRLFAGFISGSIENDYLLYLTTSTDEGYTWAAPTWLRVAASVWPVHQRFVAANDTVHIVAEQKFWNGDGFDKVVIYHQSFNAATGEYSQPQLVSNEWETNGAPRLTIGGPGKVAVWIANNVQYVRYNADPGGSSDLPTPTPTPSGISGRLIINNDDDMTTERDVRVTLFLDTQVADEYILWNEGEPEPTDYRPMLTMEAPGKDVIDWTLPRPATGGERAPCTETTVYGRLRSSINSALAPSNVMQDTILFDPGVDADVQVSNPQQADPAYTSDGSYVLDVTTTSDDECSGLVSVRVNDVAVPHTATDAYETLTLSSLVTGTHDLTIDVSDGAGHDQTYERAITLDTTAPVISPTGTLSVTSRTGQVIDDTDSTRINLHFTGMGIEDDLYGQQPGENKPFWGVLLANSRQSYAVTDTARLDDLSWQYAEVGTATGCTDADATTPPACTFTVQDWQVFAGLPREQWGTGDYHVYARVVDGAGNAAPPVLTTQVTVNEFAFYDLFLPLVLR